MYNITLVCTHHSEIGKCNSDELYKIIESIRPDVIFEELPQDLFDRFYKENNIPYEPFPEVKAVKRYIKKFTTSHIPVDINLSDTLSTSATYMFNAFSQYAVYSEIEEVYKELILQEGYSFLNSKKSEELTEKMKSVGRSLIEEAQINKEHLSRIHDLFYEEQHNRENGIIKNIYNYSGKTAYNQALLLIGSGHRKTIFEKIKKYEPENHVKLNWNLYSK